MINYVIPFGIGVIMLGIGLELTLKDFMRVFTAPKAILVGLASQMILLPTIAFGLAIASGLSPHYQLGMVLIAACPGGTASNLVTHLLKGRVALSVSLTAFNSFLTLLTIPLIVSGASEYFLSTQTQIDIGFFGVFQQVLFTVVLPVFCGMLLRHRFQDRLERIRKNLKYYLTFFLLLIFAISAWQSFGSARQFNGQNTFIALTGFLLLLNLSTIGIGYLWARITGIKHRGSYTIGIEMGLQNSALALAIAQQSLDHPMVVRTALIYASFSFFVTLGMGWLLKNYPGFNYR
jgi:BASS family bile acid:Na+ symporter